MKLPFEAAAVIVSEQPDRESVEVCIEFDANAPLLILLSLDLANAPGLNPFENTLDDARLSADASTIGFPVEVRVAELEDFCQHIREAAPKHYLRGFRLTEHNEGIPTQTLRAAVETVLAHDFV